MTRPTAYSYLRFSTPDQSRGDSFRRQSDASKRFALEHDLNLSEESYQDLGVSAYRGRNVVEGQLGKFIEAVDSGAIPEGSYLLVENLDRLSRDRIMPALQRFHSILERGIKIATLNDGKVYDRESINDLTGLIVPLVYMSRANEESATKSARGRAAWGEKKRRARENLEPTTAMCPQWLELVDGKYGVRKDRAAVVKLIFERAAAGWGKNRIARQLNMDKVPTFGRGKKWSPYFVRLLCSNPAVKGTYQPHRNEHDESGRRVRVPEGPPVQGFFPAVVDAGLFARVQQARPAPSGKVGEKLSAMPQNLLTGLVKCAKCGAKMYMVNRGNQRRTYRYLVCDNAHRDNTCDARPVPYGPVEEYVLAHVKEWGEETPDPKRSEERAARIAKREADIAEVEETLDRYLDHFEVAGSGRVAERIKALQDHLTTLQSEVSELKEQELAEESGRVSEVPLYLDYFSNSGDIVARVQAGAYKRGKDGRPKMVRWDSAASYDLLAKVSAMIRRHVERVELEHGGKRGAPPRLQITRRES